MPKVTIQTVANLDNPPTVVAQLNSNFVAIQNVIDTLLSRDGAVPNSMQALLDMNANRVVNLPVPITPTEPARHGDIQQYVDEATEQADRAEDEADRAEAEATDAEQSAEEAAASLNDLVSRYIGAYVANPSVDPQGNPLQEGAIYFNITVNNWRVFAHQDAHAEGDPVFVGDDPVIVGYWLPFPQASLRSQNDVDLDDATNNQAVVWNAGTSLFVPQTITAAFATYDDSVSLIGASTVQGAIEGILDRTSLGRYDVSFWLEGLMENSEILFRYVASRPFEILVGAPNSICVSRVAADTSTVISMKKNGVQFGTITFASAATTGTISIPGTTSFVNGDVIQIDAPLAADTALRDVSMTLAFRR